MTFDELIELRSKNPGLWTWDEKNQLLEHAWNLRIVIDVLDVTLRCWRTSGTPKTWMKGQDQAAKDAMQLVDGPIPPLSNPEGDTQ